MADSWNFRITKMRDLKFDPTWNRSQWIFECAKRIYKDWEDQKLWQLVAETEQCIHIVNVSTQWKMRNQVSVPLMIDLVWHEMIKDVYPYAFYYRQGPDHTPFTQQTFHRLRTFFSIYYVVYRRLPSADFVWDFDFGARTVYYDNKVAKNVPACFLASFVPRLFTNDKVKSFPRVRSGQGMRKLISDHVTLGELCTDSVVLAEYPIQIFIRGLEGPPATLHGLLSRMTRQDVLKKANVGDHARVVFGGRMWYSEHVSEWEGISEDITLNVTLPIRGC